MQGPNSFAATAQECLGSQVGSMGLLPFFFIGALQLYVRVGFAVTCSYVHEV